MPSLGNAVLTLKVKADELRKGLSGAKKDTETFAADTEKKTGRVKKAFGSIRESAANAAGQIPLIGGAVSKMVTAMTGPIGLAVAAIAGIGLAAVGVVKQVGRAAEETRILRNEVGLSAEAAQGWIHVAKQMGSDADAITDIFREMGIRLGEAAAEGTGPAAESIERLGLSIADLQGLSPEEQFTLLHQELSKIEDPARRAFEAEELFGGAVEKASQLINANTSELKAQADAYAENNAHSAKVIDAQEEMGKLWTEIKSALSPLIKDLAAALIPALRDFLGAVKPLMPFIRTLINIALVPLQQAFGAISTALNIVTSLLKGDFTGALNFARDFFIDTATRILEIGAKIVGLFNQDMANSIRGLVADLQGLKAAEEETTASGEALAQSTTSTVVPSVQQVTTVTKEAAENSRLMAQAYAESSQRMVDSSRLRVQNLLADYAAEVAAEGERIRAAEAAAAELERINQERAAANKAYLAQEHSDNLEAWGVTEVEYKLAKAKLKTISAEHHAALLAEAEEAGVRDLALLLAHNEAMAAAQTAHNQSTQAEVVSSNTARVESIRASMEQAAADVAAGRAAINAELAQIEREIQINVNVRRTSSGGGPPGTMHTGGDVVVARTAMDAFSSEFLDAENTFIPDDVAQQLQDAQAAVDAGEVGSITEALTGEEPEDFDPEAQHGALVKGVRNPFGRRIRVGENGTDEGIFPLPPGMLEALRSGGMRRQANDGGGRRQVTMMLDGEVLGRFVVDSMYDAAHRGRLDVDELRVA